MPAQSPTRVAVREAAISNRNYLELGARVNGRLQRVKGRLSWGSGMAGMLYDLLFGSASKALDIRGLSSHDGGPLCAFRVFILLSLASLTALIVHRESSSEAVRCVARLDICWPMPQYLQTWKM